MLANRVVLMTGAGRGLGREMTIALLRQGAKMVLTSTDRASLEETLHAGQAETGQAVVVTANLAQACECERLAAAAIAAFGRVDILVNNAGLGTDSITENILTNPFRFWEVEPAVFDKFFAVNSTAPYRLAALLAPGMVARGWGRIVNNTTSLDTMLRVGVYGGSKAALEAHTAVMATDLAGTGVTANVLVPGGAAVSRMTAGLGLPASQMIPAAAMVAPVLWLASDASDGVTGRRFIARNWDSALPAAEAAEKAGAPVAWTGYGTQGQHPAAAMLKPK